jgi:protein-tyrosine-phosphatase
MAEGLLRSLSGGSIDVHSAGTHPSVAVHPLAVETMHEQYGIDISGHRPKSVDAYSGQRFDYVITVCDAAAATCPTFPGSAQRLHWSFPDPAAVTDPVAARRAFTDTAAAIASQLRGWLADIGASAKAPPRDPSGSSLTRTSPS